MKVYFRSEKIVGQHNDKKKQRGGEKDVAAGNR